MKTTLVSDSALREATGETRPVEVSVVIPCLNEANSLAYCVDKARKALQAGNGQQFARRPWTQRGILSRRQPDSRFFRPCRHLH